MSAFSKKLIYDITPYLFFIAFYLFAYRDMLLQQSLFTVINLQPPTSNSRFYIPGQFYWYPGNLGSPAQPNIANWLPFTFVLITGNNLVLAEKLLASTTLVSCITMYFFLSNHFGGSRLVRFSAALIYGFGPATVLNFADFLHWGYAMIPIVFNYTFNLLEGKQKVKDILLLGLSLSVVTSFLPQILPLIFMSFLVFSVVRMLSLTEKLNYLRKVAICLSLAIFVFVVTTPYLISGSYQLMILIGWIPRSETINTLIPNSSSQPYASFYLETYSNQEIANTIRLIGGSPGNHLPDSSWIGFALPMLAFASLLFGLRGKKMLNLLALALVSLITITIIYGIHLQAGWALWFLYETPLALFYFPERALYLVTFAYSAAISVTIDRLVNVVGRFCPRDHFRFAHLTSRRNLEYVFSGLLVFLLLASVFLYAPVFDVQAHQERYYPLPPIYFSVQNWLSSYDGSGVYRVLFLPTDSFSEFLGTPDVFGYTTGYALRWAENYVDFVYIQTILNGTRYLGSLLAPASVKYVILATPDPNTLWKGTPALSAPLNLSGPPTYTGGTTWGGQKVQGNPLDMARILDNQRDLRLVHVEKNFRVYENMVYLPKISLFSSAFYIVGSEEALSVLPRISEFSINKNLLIFARQNPSLAINLLEISSAVIFFNADVSDYANMLSLSVGAMNTVSLKKQLYLFTQGSQTFSRSVTLPSGRYWVAVNVPEPVNVSPNMVKIDLDSAQKFVIARENFTSACNAPLQDFDNANHYFVTTAGGWISITFKGSAQVSVNIEYNSTLSNIGSATRDYFTGPVENRTFNIFLPPNASLEPVVDAYNPTIVGQNVRDNLSEIIIEHKTGGKYSVLELGGVNTTSTQTSEGGEWSMLGPVDLDSGTHKFTITNGIRGGLVAIYNTAELAQIFGVNSVSYHYSIPSETSYNINVNADRPVFLSLSESYHPNWFAYSGGERLMHFTAFSYSNGFYINRTTSGDVNVQVEYEPPLVNQVYVAQQILFAAIGLFLFFTPISRRIKHEILGNN